MNKKFILAGVPVVALLFTIITPLVNVGGWIKLGLFDLFSGLAGNPILAILFIAIPLATAYFAWSDHQYLKIAAYLMLLPALWFLIWIEFKFEGVGAGFWIYLVLSIVEIVLVLKPDLLGNMGAKEE